jgi:hypothetical protein
MGTTEQKVSTSRAELPSPPVSAVSGAGVRLPSHRLRISSPETVKGKDGKYFDIKRDIAIEKAGGVFCQACLTGRTELSPDQRYCLRCFNFLTEEAKRLLPGGSLGWAPEAPVGVTGLGTQPQKRGHNSVPTVSMVPDKTLNVSTAKRGPKHKVLPEDLIVKLARRGMSPKNIAARLCDRGILVSSRTIKRMLLTFASVGKTEGD